MTARRRVRPTALDIFFECVEARAYLYRVGEMDLHEAVDGLQEHAERHGVIAEIGQDAVQVVMGEAFRRVRLMTEKAKAPPGQRRGFHL